MLLNPAGGLLSARPLMYLLYENKPTPNKPINANSNAASKTLTRKLSTHYPFTVARQNTEL